MPKKETHKFLSIADKLEKRGIIPEAQKEEIKEAIWEDKDFTEYCLNKKEWSNEDHDKFKIIMDLNKNENGYYKDIYGNRVSYDGIRTLMKAGTELPLSKIHENEIEKCKNDFKYFRKHYCLITTRNGLARPELRHYQVALEDELLTLEDTVVLYPRQCISSSTNITINNESTTALDFFELCKLENNSIKLVQNSDFLEKPRKFIESYPARNKYIETPNGKVKVLEVHKTILYKKFKIILDNKMTLEGAYNHVVIQTNKKEIYIKDSLGAELITETGPAKVIDVIDLGVEEHMYDISIDSEDELYYSNGILSHNSGKTVTSATYLLYRALFHPQSINIGIVANKPKTAREVLDKIKKIYIELPIWMKKGSAVWNKSEIEFENGTRIMTDSPSSDSFRGYTCNFIYVDECIEENETVTIRDKETGEIQTVTMKELDVILNREVLNDQKQ